MLVFPDAVPVLIGDTVRLRELVPGDIPAWFARASDAEAAALAGDAVPESIAMGEPWLGGHRERFARQVGIRWAIVPAGGCDSVGTVGLFGISRETRSAELGIVIGRGHWNRGIGTAAARLVLRYGFGTLGLAEIRAEVLLGNLASRRLMEKLGFRLLRTGPAEADGAGCAFYGLARG